MVNQSAFRRHVAGLQAALRELSLKAWIILLLRVVAIVWVLVLLPALALFLGKAALQYPAAALPAIGGAVLGYARARTRRSRVEHRARSHGREDMGEPGDTVVWGIACGAAGFAALAAANIGVPTPGLPLGWRLFGGFSIGAAAGIGAGILLPLLIAVGELLWSVLGAVCWLRSR